MAAQEDDAQLKERFAPVAAAMADNEEAIAAELLAAQGSAVDLGGYHHPSSERCDEVMRASAMLNAIIDGM